MTFTVFGPPATKGSTRSFIDRKGHLVTKADAKSLPAWTQAVGWAARQAHVLLTPKPGAVVVTARFEFVKPASAKKRTHPTVKPDVDKTLRALLDALTGVAFEDDAQVVKSVVEKVYGQETKTVVTIEPV